MGHLKKGGTSIFAKTIFFFLKGNPYSKAKTVTSGCRCSLGDGEGLQVPCKLKLVALRKFIDLMQDELIKLKEIIMQNKFFSLLSAVFSALSLLYRGIFASR